MNKKVLISMSVMLILTSSAIAVNTSESVTQITSAVTLGEDKDLHITSTSPFTATGSVNITDTENAAVIFDNLPPSKAIAQLGFVNINGAAATSDVNCMLKIYRQGSILLPHGKEFQPLTIYSGEGLTGTSYSNFAVRTDYNLNAASLNNHFRSFKLKRGYMVCFSSMSSGAGYNRIFVADKADLIVNTLQPELYDKTSFVKIFQWNDVSKKGFAGNSVDINTVLNTTWCYDWGAGSNAWADREYVTHHHHEGWPSIATVGANGTSPNSLGNNEPDKTDGKEQYNTVDDVLANWPAMMATGKRLGSPAVAGKLSWLYDFIDSIDARGWRCDFIAVHAYWYSDAASWKSTLTTIHNRTHRPIWITEMNYGANWTGWPGTTTDGNADNYAIEYKHMQPVLAMLDDMPYMERYAYYNWVQDCRKAYNTTDTTLKSKNYLTPTGEFYANDTPDMAYDATYEYVPTPPRYYPASGLNLTFKPSTGEVTLKWNEPNGEFCDSVIVERSDNSGGYETLAVLPKPDTESAKSYSYVDTVTAMGSYAYRIHTVSCEKNEYYSKEVFNIISGSEGSGALQYGSVSASTTAVTSNFFKDAYDEMPVVIFGGVTNNNPSLAPVERLYSIDKNNSEKYGSFKFNFYPWTLSGYQTFYNKYNSAETSHYLAVQVGNGTIGSLPYEAGYVHSESNLDSTILVGKDTVYCPFRQPFAEGVIPVVMVTPRYSTSYYPYMWRVWNVTNRGFNVILQRQAGITYAGFPRQSVGYFAIAQGQGSDGNGKLFTVGRSDVKFTNQATLKTFSFNRHLTDPAIMGQMQSFNKNCAGILRFRSTVLTDSTTSVRLQLDSTDVENNVVTVLSPVTETIGWIALSADTVKTGIQSLDEKEQEGSVLVVMSSADAILIRCAGADRASIYNANGVQKANVRLCEGQATVTLSDLPRGFYIVRTNTKAAGTFIKR